MSMNFNTWNCQTGMLMAESTDQARMLTSYEQSNEKIKFLDANTSVAVKYFI